MQRDLNKLLILDSAEVLNSLEKRLSDLENEPNISNPENDTLIKASTKRDVTDECIHQTERRLEDTVHQTTVTDSKSDFSIAVVRIQPSKVLRLVASRLSSRCCTHG